jgi:hypothetical protein
MSNKPKITPAPTPAPVTPTLVTPAPTPVTPTLVTSTPVTPVIAYEEFDSRLKAIYPNITTYKQYYLDIDKEVRFTCPQHGLMKQIAKDLLDLGCSKCNVCVHLKEECSLCKGKYDSIDDYQILGFQVWGDRYTQESFVNISRNSVEEVKAKVYCIKHGHFLVDPQEHLEGRGCPACPKVHNMAFLQKAQGLFGFKYDYAGVEYINEYTEVKLRDRNGTFNVAPYLMDALKK